MTCGYTRHMEIITEKSRILSILCAHSGKWGLYISFDPNQAQLCEAAPYLSNLRFYVTRFDGQGYILSEDAEALLELYNQTVGDSRRASGNSYRGPARVYAMLCDPTGKIVTENT